jgi:hypothetical protein
MIILSGLFLETIRVARTSDPGFRIENVLTMGFDPHIAGYDLDATRTFYRRLLARVEMLAGVRNAALGEHLPLGVASSATDISIPGYELGPNQQTLSVGSSIVDDRYFDVLGIPMLRGRAFTSRDRDDAPPVVIVNEALARNTGRRAMRLARRSRSSRRRASPRGSWALRARPRIARSTNDRSRFSIYRSSSGGRRA